MIGDPTAMLELFRLSLATLVAAGHSHQRLVVAVQVRSPTRGAGLLGSGPVAATSLHWSRC